MSARHSHTNSRPKQVRITARTRTHEARAIPVVRAFPMHISVCLFVCLFTGDIFSTFNKYKIQNFVTFFFFYSLSYAFESTFSFTRWVPFIIYVAFGIRARRLSECVTRTQNGPPDNRKPDTHTHTHNDIEFGKCCERDTAQYHLQESEQQNVEIIPLFHDTNA